MTEVKERSQTCVPHLNTTPSEGDVTRHELSGVKTSCEDLYEPKLDGWGDPDTSRKRAFRIAGYTSMGLGILALPLVLAIGIAPAAVLISVGSLLAAEGGARPAIYDD